MTHTWFVGDIHGCYDAFLRLEELATTTSARSGAEPSFVALGDLIDRGPNSAGVVQHFRRGAKAGTHRSVLGNHEQQMLICLQDFALHQFEAAGIRPHPAAEPTAQLMARPGFNAWWLPQQNPEQYRKLSWMGWGGMAALESWGLDPAGDPSQWVIPAEDLAFLCSMPILIETDKALCTHALVDDLALDLIRTWQDNDRPHPDLLTFKAIAMALWQREPPTTAPDKERWHVSGHTPVERVVHYKKRRLVQADTGCCYGMRLSAWCPELERTVSVPAEL